MRIRLDKTDGFARVYDGTRYLVLSVSHNYASIKVDSYDLSVEETLTFHNVIIRISQFLTKIKITTTIIHS